MKQVVIKRCDGYSYDKLLIAITSVWEAAGGIEKYIKPGSRVLIKPNLVLAKKPETAATTHPEFVRVVCDTVIRAGGLVTIADSPGGPFIRNNLKMVYATTGMEEAAAKSGAELNYDTSFVTKENMDGRLIRKAEIITAIAEADFIINLPKLKSHGQMFFSGAVKNMYGAVPGIKKFDYHNRMSGIDEFADVITDIYLCARPGFNIMDAVVGMDGYGPTSGDPKKMDMIIASEDAFALDMAALEIIGVSQVDIPVVRAGIKRNVCVGSVNELDITGESIDAVRIRDFRMPMLDQLRVINFFDRGPLRGLVDIISPYPVVKKRKCTGCGDCERNCPAKTISMGESKPQIHMENCLRCFCCHELCPAAAIKIKRPLMTKFLFGK